MFKNRISAATERRRGNRSSLKKDSILESGERVYVLRYMVVTFPTCHAEMLALKPLLLSKTHDISVTKEVFQSSIGPYLSIVA